MATHSSILAWEIPWTERRSELERMSRQAQGSLAATQLPEGQTVGMLFSFPSLPAQPPPTSASPPQADLGASPSPHQGAQCSWATGCLLTPGVSDSGQTPAVQAIVNSVDPCLACGPPHRGDPRTAVGLPHAGDPSATICHYLQ